MLPVCVSRRTESNERARLKNDGLLYLRYIVTKNEATRSTKGDVIDVTSRSNIRGLIIVPIDGGLSVTVIRGDAVVTKMRSSRFKTKAIVEIN